jgi:hypothetical protein
MFRNLGSGCNPHTLLRRNVLDDLLEGHETAWLAKNTAVEGNGHHLRRPFATFFIQDVKCIFDMIVEVGWGAETGWDIEFIVVAV